MSTVSTEIFINVILAGKQLDPVKIMAALFIGFLIGFFFYYKVKMSVGGVVATPIIALYTVVQPISLLVYLLVIPLCIAVIEAVFNYLLIYGRRVFYISSLTSLLGTFSISLVIPVDTGVVIFSILAGIVAYNMHKEYVSGHEMLTIVFTWFAEFTLMLIPIYFVVNVL